MRMAETCQTATNSVSAWSCLVMSLLQRLLWQKKTGKHGVVTNLGKYNVVQQAFCRNTLTKKYDVVVRKRVRCKWYEHIKSGTVNRNYFEQ